MTTDTTTGQHDPTDRLSHAREQARAQVASIVELHLAHEKLSEEDFDTGEMPESADADGCTFTSTDDLEEHARESALEAQVRSDWYTPGRYSDPSMDPDRAPAEFRILLCTGGPAVRLRGDLNEHGEPTRVYVQAQDWGTPWTDVHVEGAGAALGWFAGLFYYGGDQ